MRLFYEELGSPWWHHLSSLLFSQPIQCYHRWPHRVRKEPQRLSPWIGSKFLSVFLTLLACIVSAGAWVRDLSVCPGRTLSESNGFSLLVVIFAVLRCPLWKSAQRLGQLRLLFCTCVSRWDLSRKHKGHCFHQSLALPMKLLWETQCGKWSGLKHGNVKS